MNRRITMAAASVAALVAFGACSRGEDYSDTTSAGSTAGAMATPPAPLPGVGRTTTTTVGSTTVVIDSAGKTTSVTTGETTTVKTKAGTKTGAKAKTKTNPY
jgi:hypothetical protein